MDQKKIDRAAMRVLRRHRVCCDKLFSVIVPTAFDAFLELTPEGEVLFPVGLARDGEALEVSLQAARFCPYCGAPIAGAVWQTVH
jgi:hypothetical protein